MPEPTITPEQHLLRTVSVPAFFEKVAAEAAISPPDDAAAKRLLDLGDLVAPAVGLFVEKCAAAQGVSHDAVVKAAAEAAFEAVGLPLNRAPEAAAISYLQLPGVKEAAAAMAEALRQQAEAQKAANLACGPMPPGAAKPVEGEDEEDDKKPAAPMASAA